MIKLSTLNPNPSNPRLIKDDKFLKLVKSLETFPQMMELRPIIVDENNVIQGGNMRFKALLHLGFKEIPESYVKAGKDLTPEQWKEFVIKDNVGFGEWDFEDLVKKRQVVAIEWAERVSDTIREFDDEAIIVWVKIKFGFKENERIISWGVTQ